LKVLFLDQFADLGGAQHALLGTVDAVLRAGWEACVLLPGPGPLADALRARDVLTSEIPCGPYRSGSKTASDAVRFALDLRRQVRIIGELVNDADVDLIYVNGPRLLPAAALAARSRTPIVFHLHSHLRGSALRLTRWSLRRAPATVVGCSNSVLDPLRPHIAERSLHVIPNGVRDLGYHARCFDLAHRLRIGVIGRIAPEKGQMEFVEAAALLRDEFPKRAS
jgi:glycosyltransferase involved in cell wall biosynthesis